MQVRLVERNLGTAPNPLTWKASVSLLILIPQNFGVLLVWERISYYSHRQPKTTNSLFYSTKFISKEVTPMILIQMCTLYRPRQASMTPYNLFGKSLFSHFHTEPLIPARNYFKNLLLLRGPLNYSLNLILQYTAFQPYKSSFFLINYAPQKNSNPKYPYIREGIK